MGDTISTYLSPSFSFGKRKKQTSQLCVVLWQGIAAHTRQLQRIGRSPAITWRGFGMPEENIVGIVRGTVKCGAGPRNGRSQNAHNGIFIKCHCKQTGANSKSPFAVSI